MPLRIEMWSDVVCPFCWIGKRHLEEAVRRLGMEGDVEVVHRAFRLDPAAKGSAPVPEYLARKYGSENVSVMMEQVKALGAPLGLDLAVDRAVAAPTMDAHRLIRLAAASGDADAMVERVMRAHFSEGADVSDHATLRALAMEVGLDGDAVDRVLGSDEHRDAVVQDAAEAGSLGARGVPFFVVDRRFRAMGAQPVEAFVDALEKARAAAEHSASGP